MAGHPHAGGEIFISYVSLMAPSGPSPRGWGNLEEGQLWYEVQRAIPTLVGKSHEMPIQCVTVTGHPHAGGEIFDTGK